MNVQLGPGPESGPDGGGTGAIGGTLEGLAGFDSGICSPGRRNVGAFAGRCFLFLGNRWRAQIDFLFDAHDFLAIHLHGLDPYDFVRPRSAQNPHPPAACRKSILRTQRRLAFVLNSALMLAHFLGRAPLGIDHHLAIHSHQHVVILDGIFHLRRNGFQIRFQRRLRIEIKHRTQELLQLRPRQLRNILVEVEVDKRAARVGG